MPIASEVRLDVLLKGQTAIDQILRETKTALRDLTKDIAATDSATENTKATQKDAWSEIGRQILGVTGRVTDLNSALDMGGKAIQFGKEFLAFMRESETRSAALGQFNKNFNLIADAMGRLKEASGGAIPIEQLSTGANKAALLGVGFEQLEMAMRSANHIALTTGKSFESTLDAIIETAAGTVVSADRYNEFTGSALDLKKAIEDYAKAHGVLAKDLDLSQQRAAINAATFADLATQQQAVVEVTRGWSRLTTDATDAWHTIGQAVAETTGNIYDSVGILTDHAEAVEHDSGSLLGLGYIFEQINPAFRQNAEYLRDMVGLQRQWGEALDAIRKANKPVVDEASPFNVLKTQSDAVFDYVVKREKESQKERKTSGAARVSDAEKTARELEQTQAKFQREMDAMIRKQVDQERSLWSAEMDLAESKLEFDDAFGRARIDRDRALLDAYVQFADERISAEEYAIRRSLAEHEYYLTERDIQIERQREQDEMARQSLQDTIAGLQMMDSQLGQVQGSLAKGLRTTSRIYQGIVTHIGGIVRGEAGAVSSLGAISASVIDNQQAAAAVMTVAALAEGFFALARHDYAAAGAAFTASALFGAVAGGAGASGGSGASAGGGGGGGGTQAASSGFGQSVGATAGGGGTIIVQGFVGSPQQLATTLAGEQDRSRRSNLIRSRGV